VVPDIVTPSLIFAALSGAIIWNLFTWYLGLPSSSSHALIGGLLGAALLGGGWKNLEWHGLLPVLIAIILSPILGLLISFLAWRLSNFYLHKKNHLPIEKWAKRFQFLAGALLSLGHGGNDAQKTMGIIAILLFSSGLIHGDFHIPFWIVISCNFVMALGTFMGGWRIVKTLGEKITALTPLSGSCAMGGAAITLICATNLGIPVSTTHIVTGAVVGVGGAKNWLGVNWVIIKRIVIAWFLTLPAAAIVAALIFFLEKMI
jgi:PiT family inorganic phosphate transporter